jgi:dTDP-4-dehydrorhamnose 3,5-epimerase
VKYIDTSIPEIKIIEPTVFGDNRGFFMETFRVDEFTKNCSKKPFVQDNHSKSSHGILRGLHYQLENTQGKLVRVTSGEVYDVAIDMRESSATFGQDVGVILSGENKKQLWVPEGFSHGFYVMSESAEFIYKCTDYYAPEHEVSLTWNDANLAINWPLTNNQAPSLSEKDRNALSFNEAPKFT